MITNTLKKKNPIQLSALRNAIELMNRLEAELLAGGEPMIAARQANLRLGAAIALQRGDRNGI